jgi:hypothetical protein
VSALALVVADGGVAVSGAQEPAVVRRRLEGARVPA